MHAVVVVVDQNAAYVHVDESVGYRILDPYATAAAAAGCKTVGLSFQNVAGVPSVG